MKINELVKNIVRSYANTPIIFDQKSIKIIDALVSTARSGKSVRIDNFELNLPKRSLLDHIITLGRNADYFITKSNLPVDTIFLANAIAFHDLSEIIIGDMPDFTPPYIAGNLHKTPDTKKTEEAEAENIIYTQLPSELQDPYRKTIELLHDRSNDSVKLFNFIDKTDPIISIWRYLFLFRNKLDVAQFINAMADFFTNPKILPLAISPSTAELVQFLQDKNNAALYYNDLLNISEGSELIENQIMHFINENGNLCLNS